MKHEHGMLWGRVQVAHKCTERMTGGRKTRKERRTDTAICLSTWSDRTVKRPRWKRFITLIRFLQHPEHIHGTAALRICMWDSYSYLPARVFHMQCPDHFKCDNSQGWMGNVNNEQRQWFYAPRGTIIPWRSRAGEVKLIAKQPLIVF